MVFIIFNENIKNIKLPNTIDELNNIINDKYKISDFYSIANNKLITSNNYKHINKDSFYWSVILRYKILHKYIYYKLK